MKKIKKNIIIIIALCAAPIQQTYADSFEKNALVVAGTALTIGGVHLLVKKVGPQTKKRQFIDASDYSPGELTSLTRRRSFTRSGGCQQELNTSDFYQESKKILARTCGIIGIAAGIYLILHSNEVLDKITRAQRAYTLLGYWNGFKHAISSFFAPIETAVEQV